MRRRVVIESWEEIKEKLKEKYFLEYCKNSLLDKLHNLRQGNTSVQDYIAKFKNLTLCCDMREHCVGTLRRG